MKVIGVIKYGLDLGCARFQWESRSPFVWVRPGLCMFSIAEPISLCLASVAALRMKRNGKTVWNLSKETKSDDHVEAVRWMTEKEENSHLRGREVRTECRRPGTRSVDQCHGWMEWEMEELLAH